MASSASDTGVVPLPQKMGRQVQIDGMVYAPTNEQGVVFLFGRLAARLGYAVESVQVRCPDCTATKKGKRYRIEFEYCASHFEAHRHDPRAVDLIVCWENDWEYRDKKYKHLEILDLKQFCGVQPRVYSAGCGNPENARELEGSKVQWNIPRSAQVGDLVLIYRSYGDEHAIHDAWEVVGPFYLYAEGNADGYKAGMQPYLKCISRFQTPITFEELKRDIRTRSLGVVKGRFQSARDVSDDWSALYEKILELNPQSKKKLEKYAPE